MVAAPPAMLAREPLVVAAVNPPVAASDADTVIAAYLLNFVRYVEWPETVPPSDTPWRIGVLGSAAISGTLEQMTAGKTVRGHSISAVSGEDVGAMRDCQVVFIDLDRPADVVAALQALAGRPVLTVVYRAYGNRAPGAAIELVSVARNIRYRLDPHVLAAQGLRPTPGLLENALRRSAPDTPKDGSSTVPAR
jgi:hypothetical protein